MNDIDRERERETLSFIERETLMIKRGREKVRERLIIERDSS